MMRPFLSIKMKVLKTGDLNHETVCYMESLLNGRPVIVVALTDVFFSCPEMFHPVLHCQLFGQPWEGNIQFQIELRLQCKDT